jgi:hypothetical protein
MDQYQRFKVRLLGYNSAEIKQKKITPEEIRIEQKRLAVNAKNRLTDLLLNKIVYLYCSKFDDFGRILGIIKLDPKDQKSVNQIMFEEGHGKLFLKKNK